MSGNTNFAPNSIIMGYRRVPNGDKIIKYINRRSGCKSEPRWYAILVVLQMWRHRIKESGTECALAVRIDWIWRLPPPTVITFVGKRKLQQLRKRERTKLRREKAERRQRLKDSPDVDVQAAVEKPPQQPYWPLELPPLSSELVSKIAISVRKDRSNDTGEVRKNKVWNRDVIAGRNILCKGMCETLNSFLYSCWLFVQLKDFAWWQTHKWIHCSRFVGWKSLDFRRTSVSVWHKLHSKFIWWDLNEFLLRFQQILKQPKTQL